MYAVEIETGGLPGADRQDQPIILTAPLRCRTCGRRAIRRARGDATAWPRRWRLHGGQMDEPAGRGRFDGPAMPAPPPDA
ncbi:hypothetical protein WS95_29600 [Burkholderia sp. MSMB1826]|nr:hypothetical protein WS95_29600 [Burkholderia sp. MSMB1826]